MSDSGGLVAINEWGTVIPCHQHCGYHSAAPREHHDGPLNRRYGPQIPALVADCHHSIGSEDRGTDRGYEPDGTAGASSATPCVSLVRRVCLTVRQSGTVLHSDECTSSVADHKVKSGTTGAYRTYRLSPAADLCGKILKRKRQLQHIVNSTAITTSVTPGGFTNWSAAECSSLRGGHNPHAGTLLPGTVRQPLIEQMPEVTFEISLMFKIFEHGPLASQ